jgi:hypothetical protein
MAVLIVRRSKSKHRLRVLCDCHRCVCSVVIWVMWFYCTVNCRTPCTLLWFIHSRAADISRDIFFRPLWRQYCMSAKRGHLNSFATISVQGSLPFFFKWLCWIVKGKSQTHYFIWQLSFAISCRYSAARFLCRLSGLRYHDGRAEWKGKVIISDKIMALHLANCRYEMSKLKQIVSLLNFT